MNTWWQDVRYASRMLSRSPGFSVMVVVLVAVGVGASTTVFSILNPILLRPLPYEEPDRIVCVEGRNKEGHARAVSHTDYLDWRRQATSFSELGCVTFRDRPASITADEPPEECCIGFVSDNFFRVFRARPALGRFLSPADDRPGAAPAVVLGHAFWQHRFAADPNIVGRSILLDSVSHTIIGVTPPGFDYLPYGADTTDVWVAVALTMGEGGRANSILEVLGRVKTGVSIDRVQAEMDIICDRLGAEYPSSNAGISATVTRLHDSMARQIGHVPSILMGSVFMVFLVACANVAGLMFARGVTREREMALRSALGGTRLRLLRLMLLEHVVLALLGGCLGVLGATWAIQLLLRTGMIPSTQFPAGFFRPDWHVLGFALALSILGAPACGLFPSIRCSAIPLARILAAGSRGVLGSRGRNTTHTGLLATQIALTVILLVAAGLMTRSLVNLLTADRGFDSRNILVADLQLTGERYAGRESRIAFHRQLLDRLGDTPGIEKAALTWPLLGGWRWSFHVEGEPTATPAQEGMMATYKAVSPGYFQAMGIQLLRGRLFEEADGPASPSVVIVDQTLAARYWPDGDGLGMRIKTNTGDDLWYDTLVRRFVASLLAVSAGIALLLSATGIYAITRYSVLRRTQEFGVRMALGADRNDVLRLVFKKGLMPVLIGTGTGLAGAVAVARVLSSLLYQLSPWDPLTYTGVSLLLIGVALLACYLPARYAARVDPMVALRYE